MAKLIDLKASKVQDRQRQVGTYGTQTPLSSTAVDRGTTRWLNGSAVSVDGTLGVEGSMGGGGSFDWSGSFTQSGGSTFSGNVDMVGPTSVSGNFTVTGPTDLIGDVTSSGHFTQTGPTDLNGVTTIAGDTTVTGVFDVDGPMKTTGTLDVEGVTTLKADLNVTTGGKIKVGTAMTLDPITSGGSIAFAGGGGVQGSAGVTAMKGAGNAGFLSNDTASMFAGPNSVDVETDFVTISGPIKNTGMPTTTSAANVYYNPSTNQLYYKP